MSAPREQGPSRGARIRGAALGALLIGAAAFTPGCYTTQLGLLRSGLDSLRTQVDTMTVRDSVAYRVLADTRRDVAQQRDILLSTRASSGSTTQELFDQMSRLEGKLDEVMHRFTTVAERASGSTLPSGPVNGPATSPGSGSPVTGAPGTGPPPAAGPGTAVAPGTGGPTPSQTYELATRDLTEGRYALALQGYRDFLRRFPDTELADDAQYGIGECFFAQVAFDSAAVEYGHVQERWPKSDRIPAALYKLGICQERLARTAEARKTFEDLVRRFPASSEAGLARDRIGAAKR